ncbi:5898_t:CDS:2 [Ambispora leptoticha]|uniref:5898_t:CDS:1 n=1 Tax=Ambispora leptoticha TaxID=144679 RepID=A0A9N9NA20_9GLOM|nr:5898_t:CDS:2 [Ambispora leptoticha]
MEQELEKEFAELEKITGKTKEYHFEEALINYIQDIEEIEETEKHIKKNKMPSNYHIIQALIMYIQDDLMNKAKKWEVIWKKEAEED